MMKRFFSRLLSVFLVVTLFLAGCSATSSSLTGNYRQDTLALIGSLRTAIESPDNSPEKAIAQSEARNNINEFISRYRRDNSVSDLNSFMTVRTALDSLAGHYSSYPNRPVPQKLKDRLEQEFRQVESALSTEAG